MSSQFKSRVILWLKKCVICLGRTTFVTCHEPVIISVFSSFPAILCSHIFPRIMFESRTELWGHAKSPAKYSVNITLFCSKFNMSCGCISLCLCKRGEKWISVFSLMALSLQLLHRKAFCSKCPACFSERRSADFLQQMAKTWPTMPSFDINLSPRDKILNCVLVGHILMVRNLHLTRFLISWNWGGSPKHKCQSRNAKRWDVSGFEFSHIRDKWKKMLTVIITVHATVLDKSTFPCGDQIKALG